MQFTAFSFVYPCGYPPDSPDHSIIREAFVEALMTMPREQAVAVLGELLRNRPTLAPRLGAVLDGVYEMFLVFGHKLRNNQK